MRLCLFVLMFCLSQSLISQVDHSNEPNDTISSDTSYQSKDDFNFTAFPLAFYLPETSLAFGAVGIMVFNAGEFKTWRKSQIQLGLSYTLKKQFLLFIPYEVYFKQNWKWHGELGYYRYFYNYFGIGIDAQKEDLETFDATYPRVISTLAYRLTDHFLAGIQYRFDNFKIPRTDSLLTAQNPTGINGGIISTIGLSLTYDSRDDIFYPRKGLFANAVYEVSEQFTGSNFDYSLLQFDLTYYYTFKEKHTIAANLYTGFTFGDAPFFTHYYLSSGKRGRGFNDRRFIDRNIELLQIEYRYPIYKRLRGTAFVSSGTVIPTLNDLFNTKQKLSYGAGLRFQLNKKQMSHIRADVAHSNEGFQFYITIGEAF